jgi:hypothetical protein
MLKFDTTRKLHGRSFLSIPLKLMVEVAISIQLLPSIAITIYLGYLQAFAAVLVRIG